MKATRMRSNFAGEKDYKKHFLSSEYKTDLSYRKDEKSVTKGGGRTNAMR